MRRTLFILATGALFFLVFGITLGTRLPASFFQARIEDHASREGFPLEISGGDYRFLSGLGFDKVVFLNSDKSRDLFHIQTGQFRLHLLPILKNRVQLSLEGIALNGRIQALLRMSPLLESRGYSLVLQGSDLDLSALETADAPPALVRSGKIGLNYAKQGNKTGRAGSGTLSLSGISLELTQGLLKGVLIADIQGNLPFKMENEGIVVRNGSIQAKGAVGTVQGEIEYGPTLRESRMDLYVDLAVSPDQLDRRIGFFLSEQEFRFRIQGSPAEPVITAL